MMPVARALLAFAVGTFRSRSGLQLEVVALRHQLALYHRSIRRPRVRPSDRIFWSWLARHWARWQEVLMFVQPATVIGWQRRRFRAHWARLSRKEAGRPPITKELRALIQDISVANPRWGSPRILGELRKLGIAVAKSTIEQYRVRRRRPPHAPGGRSCRITWPSSSPWTSVRFRRSASGCSSCSSCWRMTAGGCSTSM